MGAKMKKTGRFDFSIFTQLLAGILAIVAIIMAVFSVSSCATGNSVSEGSLVSEEKDSFSKITKEEFLALAKKTAAEEGAEKALLLYSDLPSKYERDYDIQFFKARLLNVTGKLEEAKVIADSLLLKKSDDEELKALSYSIEKKLFMNALSLALEKENEEKALLLYEDLPSLLANDFNLNLVKASLLIACNRLDEAENLCNLLDGLKADTNEVLELRAEIASRRGDSKAKNAQLQKLLKKDPYNPEANISLAKNATVKKSYAQAKQYYQKALVREPKNEEALFGLGQTDYYLENDEKSRETFEKLLKVNPENDAAYSYLGKLDYAQNKYKKAVDNIEKAIAIDDSNYDYWTDYGTYLRYTGRFEDAEKAWTRAIEIQPEYFLAYGYRAGLYDEQDRFEEALKDYEMVVKLNPDYYFAYESIGILALHEKDYVRAGQAFMECAKKANAKEVTNISYPLMITYCYHMLKKPAEAKKYAGKVLAKIKKNDSVEYHMLRMFGDGRQYANNPLPQKIAAMKSMNERSKMYFYLGLFYDMIAGPGKGKDYYAKALSSNSPMFFEYRIAEWNIKEAETEDE